MPRLLGPVVNLAFYFMSNDNDAAIQHGEVTATYFWDDGSGINGDTGMPAGGEPMQQGLFSSPSWPLGTEGYIVYEDQKVDFFIGDRGPGHPSYDCDVLLDIDAQTFAEITGETWDPETYVVSGGNGHLDVEYYITEWGDGDGEEGAPHPFEQPENSCEDAVSPVPEAEQVSEDEEPPEESEDAEAEGSEDADAKGSDQDQAEEEANGAGANDDGDESTDEGVSAETAANDTSGLQLTGADGALGGTGGLLTLAIIPAILLALAFLWFRRPVGAHAGIADESGKKSLTHRSTGRHSTGSKFGRSHDKDD